MTADPLFVVFEKERVYGIEQDGDGYIWVDDDGEEADDDQTAELDKLDKDWKPTRIDGVLFEKRRFVVKDRFVTACFTKSGADDYIKANGHNHTEPFIYVASLFRNREMIQVRQHLMATHRPQTNFIPRK